MCCVACAVQYVRAALGDVGNNVTGQGLRCLFHSMLGSAGGEACRGILEPSALKLLVGRNSGGQVTAMAEAAAAFSTSALAEQEAHDEEQRAAQARLAAVARASEAFMQQQEELSADSAFVRAATVEMPAHFSTVPPIEDVAVGKIQRRKGDPTKTLQVEGNNGLSSEPLSWGFSSVLPVSPILMSPLELATSSPSFDFGAITGKSNNAYQKSKEKGCSVLPPLPPPPRANAARAASVVASPAVLAAAALAAAEAAVGEKATAPLSMTEVQRLGRFVYEAGIQQHCRFYCTNKTICGRLFEVEEHLLNSDINQALSTEECCVECPFCDRASCVRCKIPFHGALSCYEVEEMGAERAVGAGEGGGGGREKSGLSMELIRATSKPCPSCSMSISHYHGHACHHIAPGTGCVNCGYHFCFSCGQPAGPAIPAGSSGCSCPAYCINDHVLSNIKKLPIPHDTRCGCVFCPDCKCTILPPAATWKKHDKAKRPRGGNFEISEKVATGKGMTVVPHPCAQCDGTCVVCTGLVTPRSLSVHKSGRLSMAL